MLLSETENKLTITARARHTNFFCRNQNVYPFEKQEDLQECCGHFDWLEFASWHIFRIRILQDDRYTPCDVCAAYRRIRFLVLMCFSCSGGHHIR